jgi:adenylylsulfate kinase-like enzyme
MSITRLPVVWITGLAGSGKTTLGKRLVAELRAQGRAVVHVDGDSVRSLMGSDLGYGTRDRIDNAYRIARLCKFLQGEGVLVVCSTMSLYPEIWQFNRHNLEPYLQVFLDVPMDVLAERDQKGLYSGVALGQASDVGGLDLPVSLPIDSDLVLENSDAKELPHNVELILRALGAPPARHAEPEVRA